MFETVGQLVERMQGFAAPWWVAGGWAVDLALGQITRPHADLEVAILRRDQLALQAYLRDLSFSVVLPGTGGQTRPWTTGEELDLPLHELHGTAQERGPGLEVLLNEAPAGVWRFRRDPRITRPVDRFGRIGTRGVPILSPEVVLLYKATAPQAKDEADFAALQPVLDPEPRAWLVAALALHRPGHPWLDHLAAPTAQSSVNR
jgi:hypothetical protein